jgi:hypothetical protein
VKYSTSYTLILHHYSFAKKDQYKLVIMAATSPWSTAITSAEDMTDYLQADSGHNKRTQERAQSLLDSAAYITCHKDTFSCDNTIRDLNGLANHGAYKQRLDALRYFFQTVPPAVLPRLKRSSHLVAWLCDIATYAPIDGSSDTVGADISALVSRAHPLRGKALSVLALLLRHTKATSHSIPSSTTDNVTDYDVDGEDHLSACIAAAVALVLAKPLLMPSSTAGTNNATNAMIGSVLLHQSVDLWEMVCGVAVTQSNASANEDNTPASEGITVVPETLAQTQMRVLSSCMDSLCTLMTTLSSIIAPIQGESSIEAPAGLSNPQILARILVDISKALATSAEARGVFVGNTVMTEKLCDVLEGTHRVSPATIVLLRQLEQDHMTAEDCYVSRMRHAAQSIAQLSMDGPVIHNAYASSFHSLVIVLSQQGTLIPSSGVDTEGRTHLLDLENALLNIMEGYDANDLEQCGIADPSGVRRAEELVGMLGSIWERLPDPLINNSNTSLTRIDRIVATLTNLQNVLQTTLRAYGRTSDGKPDKNSNINANDRTEMRSVCGDCRAGCISASEELLSRNEGLHWIREKSDMYWIFGLKTMAAPTLLVPAYIAFKNGIIINDETAVSNTSTNGAAEAGLEKVFVQLYSALKSTKKYSLKAALDVIQAMELLGEAGCVELLAPVPVLFSDDDETQVTAPLAEALVHAYTVNPVLPTKQNSNSKGDNGDEGEEEPPLLTWRRHCLVALDVVIKETLKTSSSDPLNWDSTRCPLGFLLRILSYELTALLMYTRYDDGSEEKGTASAANKLLFNKYLKKILRARYGSTDVEMLQSILTQVGNLFITVITAISGQRQDGVPKDWRVRWGSSGSGDIEETIALLTKVDDSTQANHINLPDPLLEEYWTSDFSASMPYLQMLLNTIQIGAGRPCVYDSDQLQQCLELDIATACVSGLGQLLFAIRSSTDDSNIIEIMDKTWKEVVFSAIHSGIKAAGLDRAAPTITLLSEGTSAEGVILARSTLKKLYMTIGPIYGYARELILLITDSLLWIKQQTGTVLSLDSINELMIKLNNILPASLDPVVAASTTAAWQGKNPADIVKTLVTSQLISE